MGRKKKEPESVYWHGGAVGRAIGDHLIPGTDVPGYSNIVTAIFATGKFDELRPDYVYITTDRNLAFDYAISWAKFGPAAALYRVKPLGHLEHDPDYPRGISHRCRSAVVLAVEPDVITAETPETGAAFGYETWDDDSPLYDSEGYPLPNKTHQHFGVTPAHLRSLGYRADFEAIAYRCTQEMRELNPNLTPADFIAYQQKLS
jgi:hypothetical protein